VYLQRRTFLATAGSAIAAVAVERFGGRLLAAEQLAVTKRIATTTAARSP